MALGQTYTNYLYIVVSTMACLRVYQPGKLEQLQATNQQLIEVKRESEECLRRQEEDAKEQMLKTEGQAQENMRQYEQKVENRFKDQERQAAEEKSHALQQAEHRQQLAVEEAHRKATVQMREDAGLQQSRMEALRGFGTVRIPLADRIFSNTVCVGIQRGI